CFTVPPPAALTPVLAPELMPVPPSDVPPSTDAFAPALALAVLSSAAAAGSANAAAARLHSAIETSFCIKSSFCQGAGVMQSTCLKKQKGDPEVGIAFAAAWPIS